MISEQRIGKYLRGRYHGQPEVLAQHFCAGVGFQLVLGPIQSLIQWYTMLLTSLLCLT